MAEPLPILIAISVEIAWDYLERTGELGDAAADPLANQADASVTFVACGPFWPCSGSNCTFAFSASVL